MYTKEEVTNSRREKEINDKEKKYDESKTRWEKNSAREVAKEEQMDVDSSELEDLKSHIKVEQE